MAKKKAGFVIPRGPRKPRKVTISFTREYVYSFDKCDLPKPVSKKHVRHLYEAIPEGDTARPRIFIRYGHVMKYVEGPKGGWTQAKEVASKEDYRQYPRVVEGKGT